MGIEAFRQNNYLLRKEGQLDVLRLQAGAEGNNIKFFFIKWNLEVLDGQLCTLLRLNPRLGIWDVPWKLALVKIRYLNWYVTGLDFSLISFWLSPSSVQIINFWSSDTVKDDSWNLSALRGSSWCVLVQNMGAMTSAFVTFKIFENN